MNETMGQRIKRLRKARNLTQEELAEQLNLSAQAISKWENGTSLPDISQVLPLANFFGVPTDVLFGVYGTDHNEEIKARLEEIYRLCDACPDGEEGTTALTVLDKYREAIRLYPGHAGLLTEAMAFADAALSFHRDKLAALLGEQGVEDLARETAHWAELVIKYSSSPNDLLSAKRRLFDLSLRQGKWKDAEAVALDFPRDFSDFQGILMAQLKQEAKEKADERKWRCSNVASLVKALGQEAAMLGNWYKNEKKYNEALSCYSFLQDMVEALYRDEPYRPPFVYDDGALYASPAFCLMKLGKTEEAVELLERGVAFIKAQATSFNKKSHLDIPLLCDEPFRYGYDGDACYHDLAGRLRRLVCDEAFEPLRENPRYQALKEKIMAGDKHEEE